MEEEKERVGIPSPDLRCPPTFQPWLSLCPTASPSRRLSGNPDRPPQVRCATTFFVSSPVRPSVRPSITAGWTTAVVGGGGRGAFFFAAGSSPLFFLSQPPLPISRTIRTRSH